MYSKKLKEPQRLPVSETFADIGATIADNFNVKLPQFGNSLLTKLK